MNLDSLERTLLVIFLCLYYELLYMLSQTPLRSMGAIGYILNFFEVLNFNLLY